MQKTEKFGKRILESLRQNRNSVISEKSAVKSASSAFHTPDQTAHPNIPQHKIKQKNQRKIS